MRDRGKTLEMYGGEELGSCCRKHPSQASGGICALCLKDKLSKLVCSDCGEQRPPSCSCSEAASSSSNKDASKAAGTVDVGSAGRISFLIESDNVADLITGVGGQFQCDAKSTTAKPDAIVLLKRSKSVACTTGTPTPTTPPPLVAPLLSPLPPLLAAGAGDYKSPLPPLLAAGAGDSKSPLPPLLAAGAGDSKVRASDNDAKRPSSFWSFLYFVKSKPTPTKNNNNKNNKSDQPKRDLVVSHRPAEQGLVRNMATKENVAYRQQEVLCNRPAKQTVGSGKSREPGFSDFVGEVSPRATKHGMVNRRSTEHRGEQEALSAHPVHESPLWILPRLLRSRSVGCGRNSFSVDQDDISESGLKIEAKGHMRATIDDKKPSMTKGKCNQSKSRSPRGGGDAPATTNKEVEQAKAKRQSSVKPKGFIRGFGKSSAALYGIASVVSNDGSQTSGASAGWSRGWSWAFSSPARIFKHRKLPKETINNNNNGFMNQDTSKFATSNSAGAAVIGD